MLRHHKIWTIIFISHPIILPAHKWSERIMWLNVPQLKLENIWETSSVFTTAQVAKSIWRIINTTVSIWHKNMLPRIFVLGHYLFLGAHSFPQAALLENCLLLKTDYVRGQISTQCFRTKTYEVYGLFIPFIPCSTINKYGKCTCNFRGVFFKIFYILGVFKRAIYSRCTCWIWDEYSQQGV